MYLYEHFLMYMYVQMNIVSLDHVELAPSDLPRHARCAWKHDFLFRLLFLSFFVLSVRRRTIERERENLLYCLWSSDAHSRVHNDAGKFRVVDFFRERENNPPFMPGLTIYHQIEEIPWLPQARVRKRENRSRERERKLSFSHTRSMRKERGHPRFFSLKFSANWPI